MMQMLSNNPDVNYPADQTADQTITDSRNEVMVQTLYFY